MQLAAVLGQEIEWQGGKWLVVRLIQKSLALFEENDGSLFTVDESYAEIKGPHGELDFITLLEEIQPFTNKKSTIRALDPVAWRVKK